MKKLLLLLLMIGLVTGSNRTMASCAYLQTVEQGANQADAIFAGRVIDSKETNSINFSSGWIPGIYKKHIVLFDVTEVWKGPSKTKLEIKMTLSSVSYSFTEGHKYLIYARKLDDHFLTTDSCTRTALYSAASEDLQFLGKGSPPKISVDSSEQGKNWFLIFLGAFLVAGLFVFIVIKKKRKINE